ncbi:MAG: hypothetical protein ACOC4Z_02520 [Patescibacteria group bacterium]
MGYTEEDAAKDTKASREAVEKAWGDAKRAAAQEARNLSSTTQLSKTRDSKK